MNAKQLLKQIETNRGLITTNSEHAYEHLQLLKNNYAHLINEEIELNIELSNSLVELHFNSNYQAAIDNSMAALERFKNSIFNKVVSIHLKTIGFCYAHTGEFDLAERYLLEAMSALSANDADYISDKGHILFLLAMNLEFKEGSEDQALNYLIEAIELMDDKEYALKRANCLMGMGNIYNNKNDIPEALRCYRQAAEVFEDGYSLANMASVYSNIGNCYIKIQEFEQAEQYHLKSLDLRLKFSSPAEICISYFNLGVFYKAVNNFAKSDDYLHRAQKISEELGTKPFNNQINEELDDLARKRKGYKSLTEVKIHG